MTGWNDMRVDDQAPGGHEPTAGDRRLERLVPMVVSSTIAPWSVARLCAASGVSARTLHRYTVREYGLSPMALIRRERLARARAELQAAGVGATVTSVALRWGFTHLGRFARDYGRQFGEAPSDTLRGARLAARPDAVVSTLRLATPPSAARIA